jgi:hypothetical protein
VPGTFSDFKGDIWNFGDVLKWIKENVPCTTGQIAAEWTQRVYDEARLRNIDHTVVQAALATALTQGYRFDMTDPDVARMSKIDKIKAAIILSGSYLPGDVYNVVRALAEPKSLVIMAGTVIAWAGSHAVGLGEVIDLILLGVGFMYIGFSAFAGAGELVDFIQGALGATTHADLDDAGHHFARAVTLLGISVIQALLLRGPVKAFRERPPLRLAPPPPPGRLPRIRYKPQLPGGRRGLTDPYGDVYVSTSQSLSEQRVTLFHELVHRFFSPKVAALRKLRAELAWKAYERSAFLRYLEEAMAEGWGQLREHGLLSSLKGLYFPFANGYVTLSEAAQGGNLMGTIMLAGRRIYVYISTGQIPVEAQ